MQAALGLFVVVGAFATWRQVHVTREGQITDRYTKAIDQLGRNDALDVQLGGIYALERIARDSPHDRATIVEVLTAFVRGHAPSSQRTGAQGELSTDVGVSTLDEVAALLREIPPLAERLPTVQAAMDVLGRLHRTGEKHAVR